MAYRASGIMPQQLQDEPALPGLTSHLWNWFLDLHQARPETGFGASPLSWSELHSWQQMTGIRLKNWELSAIRSLDRVALSVLNKK